MDAEAKREKRREANRRYYVRRKAEKAAEIHSEAAPTRNTVRVPLAALARSRVVPQPTSAARNPFAAYTPFPGAVGSAPIAMDASIDAASSWASSEYEALGAGTSSYWEGFLGYPELALLAQKPEYRRISETIAMEMTREWVEITSTGDDDKSEQIAKLEAEMKRLKVRDVFREAAEQDGFFGRSHIYIDLGTTDQPGELATSIGNGLSDTSTAKIGQGSVKALRCVEAVWCYPADYNSNNPLRSDWYRPNVWMVQGTRVHSSRLLTFIGREVPDLLKPAYSFGGLSMTQIAKPYVENWLRTRQSVADIVSAFSVFVLKTNMAEALNGDGDAFFDRLALFTNVRDNRGVLAVDKEREDFDNVSAPLSGLDSLQAQTQEHMAAVSGIPLVKLTGISPSGLNASSEEEMECFETWIKAYQEKLFREHLETVLRFLQLSLFGSVDPTIGFVWKPLGALSEKERAEVRKVEAETGAALIQSGAIDRSEERERIAREPDSPYASLDLDKAPTLDLRTQAEIAAGMTNAIMAAADAVGPAATLSELSRLSAVTGTWSSITPEMIAEAEAEPPMPEMDDDDGASDPLGIRPPAVGDGQGRPDANGDRPVLEGPEGRRELREATA